MHPCISLNFPNTKIFFADLRPDTKIFWGKIRSDTKILSYRNDADQRLSTNWCDWLGLKTNHFEIRINRIVLSSKPRLNIHFSYLFIFTVKNSHDFQSSPPKLLLIVASTFHNNTVEFPSNKIEQNEIFISSSSVHYLSIIQINIYICGHANLHKYFNRINIWWKSTFYILAIWVKYVAPIKVILLPIITWVRYKIKYNPLEIRNIAIKILNL